MGDVLRGVFDARGAGSFAGLLDALDRGPQQSTPRPRPQDGGARGKG